MIEIGLLFTEDLESGRQSLKYSYILELILQV